MAWTNAHWTRNGIVDSVRVVMCDNRSLSEGAELTGIKSLRIVGNHDGDVKWSGQIEVSNSNFTSNKALRVYYRARVDGESTEILLGTFFTGSETQEFLHGRYSGTIDLFSMLKRFSDAEFTRPFTFKKNSSAKSSFWQLVQLEGAKATTVMQAGIADKKWSAAETIDIGNPVLSGLNKVASFLNTEVVVNRSGQIVLRPYILPSKRARSYTVPSGASSIVFEGLDIENTSTDVVNRYTVVHKKKEKYKVPDGTYKNNYTDRKGVYHPKGSQKYKTKTRYVPVYGTVELAASSAYSYAKRGRHVDKHETIKNMKPETAARAKEIARQRLEKVAKGGRDWTFESFFMPYTLGNVIRFIYKDTPKGTTIDIDGMVTDIEYEYSPSGMKMKTTIMGLRSNA